MAASLLMDVASVLQRFILEMARSPRRQLHELGDAYGASPDVGAGKLMAAMGRPDQVASALVGSVANVANKTMTLVTTLLAGVPSLFVPFLKTKYENIDRAAAQRQSAIEAQFPEIFTHAHKIWKDDASLVAFMLEPVVVTAGAVGSVATDIILDLIDAIAGNKQFVSRFTKNRQPRRRFSAGTSESLSLRSALLNEFMNKRADVTDEQLHEMLLDEDGLGAELDSSENARRLKELGEEAKRNENDRLHSIINMHNKLQNMTREELQAAGINASKLSDEELKQQMKLASDATKKGVREMFSDDTISVAGFKPSEAEDRAIGKMKTRSL